MGPAFVSDWAWIRVSDRVRSSGVQRILRFKSHCALTRTLSDAVRGSAARRPPAIRYAHINGRYANTKGPSCARSPSLKVATDGC
jgi:hypothetical protein